MRGRRKSKEKIASSGATVRGKWVILWCHEFFGILLAA